MKKSWFARDNKEAMSHVKESCHTCRSHGLRGVVVERERCARNLWCGMGGEL